MYYPTSKIDALVLAGGTNRIMLFDGYTPGYKAVLPFHGRPLIDYTLEALEQCAAIQHICVVGPEKEIKASSQNAGSGRTDLIASGETLIENIHKGLTYLSGSSLILVMPADLPLVTVDMVRMFIDMAGCFDTTYPANIFWSMVPEQYFTPRYQKVQKGFNRFKDISLCHGNLLLMTPSVITSKVFTMHVNDIYRSRKSSIRAAAAIGLSLGLTYLFGVHLFQIVTLSRFARMASERFKIGFIPVIMGDPEIAIDIDERRDYEFAWRELTRRQNISGTGTKFEASLHQEGC